jgi:hypothetical protein
MTDGLTHIRVRRAPALLRARCGAIFVAAIMWLGTQVSPAAAQEPTRPAAFSFGGVQLQPDTITVSAGEVSQGATVVRANARRRAVAAASTTSRVKAPIDLGTHDRVESGAVFHEVEYFDRDRKGDWVRTAFWCGPFISDTLRGRREVTQCVQGGVVFAADPSTAWLAAAPKLTFVGNLQIDLPLQPLEQDPLGSFDVEINVEKVSRTEITLAAVAIRSGERVVFWKGRERLSPSAEARFPFWTKTLVVRKLAGRSVLARLEDAEDIYGLHAVRQIDPPQSIRW